MRFLIFIFLAGNTFLHAQDYKNPALPTEHRVSDLLKRMTLEEKAAQLSCIVFWDEASRFYNLSGQIDREKALPYTRNGLGQLGLISYGYDSITARGYAKMQNKIQKHIIESSRFGIPAIFHDECLHGLMSQDATIFPQAIAMSCSWDTVLIKKVFTTIARESRSRGVSVALTPMLDVVRDPRWGRTEESYGEDPFLVSCYAQSIVKGLQGNRQNNNAPLSMHHVAATAKHFAGHGQMEGGLNLAPGSYSERYFRETFLPPFAAAVQKAHVMSVMAAYHEMDGVPCHASKNLINGILRTEMGFNGLVVSDYDGITKMHQYQNISSGPAESARLAMNAGIDVDLPEFTSYATLAQQVKEGSVDMKMLDMAVFRILKLKILLGLFENPYADPEEAHKYRTSAKSRELSLEIAKKSVVLLKNDGKILPLDKSKYKTIAIIGPTANKKYYGGYSVKTTRGFSLLEGLQNKLGSEVELICAEGCKIHQGPDGWMDKKNITLVDASTDSVLLSEALRVARKADLIILAVGETPAIVGEHSGSVADLGLAGRQNQLAQALVATGKPIVAVITNGRPLSINYLDRHVPAILETWFLGEEGGNAIAGILTGETNPSGKLSITFPRSEGHIPDYYAKKSYDTVFSGYIFDTNKPLYPFGYGLSYTTFEYSNLRVHGRTDSIYISVDVKNTGNRAGDEIVQMYVRDKIASVTRPVKELKGFRRISLDLGNTQTVTFRLSVNDLKFYNQNMQWDTEPGEFEFMVGNNSVSLLKQTILLQ